MAISDGLDQAELDRRFRITAADREALRRGVLPERIRLGGRRIGCLSFAVIVLGAGAGAFFAWNTYPVLGDRIGLGASAFAGLLAVVGAVLAFVMFRRRFGATLAGFSRTLREGRVRSELLELRILEPAPGRRDPPLLRAADGREFQAPPALEGAPIAGRFRTFYLDFSHLEEVAPNAPPPFARPLVVVALEHTTPREGPS